MCNDGIKSKARVAEFGEVFTPKNIVNDMLNLVKDESYRLDSTFLEPACGNGNFLEEILLRKLETAKRLGIEQFEKNMFIALSSIYGIDIQLDNVEESKARMLEVIKSTYKDLDVEASNDSLKTYVYILDKNIIWGNALTEEVMGDMNTGEEYVSRPELKITEWEIQDANVKMTEYTLKEIADTDTEECEQITLSEFYFNERVSNTECIIGLSAHVTDKRIESIFEVHKEYKKAMDEIKVKKEKATDNKASTTVTKKKSSKAMSAW